MKRKRVEAQRPVVVQRTGNNRLQTMASQVKEVLPHVPMATILYDLSTILYSSFVPSETNLIYSMFLQ